MDKKDFRIKEFRGEFTIQRKFKDKHWFSKKVTESWEGVTVYGSRIDFDRFGHMIMLSDFKSLEDAKKWLNKFLEGAKYHEI